MKSINHLIAVDTETTGLDTWSPKVQTTHISWFDHKGRGDVVSLRDGEKLSSKIRKRLLSKKWIKVFWNAKFDLRMLEKCGVMVKGPIADAMIAAQILMPEEREYSLKHFSRKFLKYPYMEETNLKKWQKDHTRGKEKPPYGLAPKHIIYPYALADARRTLECFSFLRGGLDKHKLWGIFSMEMKLMRRVVMPMEDTGVYIDTKNVQKLQNKAREESRELREEISKAVGDPEFNPNSHRQVAKAVFDGTIRPTRFTKSGQPKVDELALLETPSNLGTKIVRYRKVQKASSTYLENFARRTNAYNRLRVSFNQCGARTGRFSSSNPNLQNIPRPGSDTLGLLRSCIRSTPKHRLVFIDYSQLEIRICAHFTQEDDLIHSIKSGLDTHGEICKKVFEIDEDHEEWAVKRYLSKQLNLASQYGMGAEKYKDTVLLETEGDINLSLMEAYQFMREYKAKRPKLMGFFSKVTNEVAKYGGVFNHFRRFMVVDRNKPYVGVNYKIQSTAADLLKKKMLELAKFLKGKKTKMIMQIHDEIVFDMPQEEKHLIPRIHSIMEEPNEFLVPLTCTVSIAKHWNKKKDYALQ